MANETKGKFDNLSNKIKDHAAQSAANTTQDDAKSGKGLFGSLFKPTASSAANTQTNTQTGTKPTVFGTPAVKPTANTTATTTAAKPTATTATTAAKPTSTASTATAVKPTGTASVKPTGTTSTASVKPTGTVKSKFTDVPSDAYYADAVAWAVKNGITSGTTETTFAPENPCHRGHAATFLWRANGSPAPKNAKNPFSDVSEGPFYQAILWASSNAIIPGKTATTFAHTEPCTRGQVLTYMLRAEGKPAATEADAIKWAAGKRLLAGLSGSTSLPCTRADFVTFLYRAKTN